LSIEKAVLSFELGFLLIWLLAKANSLKMDKYWLIHSFLSLIWYN